MLSTEVMRDKAAEALAVMIDGGYPPEFRLAAAKELRKLALDIDMLEMVED